MDIRIATRNFERWLGAQIKLVQGDLRHKHIAMRADAFSFLRSTYYRWAQQVAALDQMIAKAPVVLAVGDLHLENFGTWRDTLGRLAWGINDFDEAFPLPYTHDLVRLAASALLTIDQDQLRLGPKAACKAIMEGYREGFAAGGRPFVIGEEHRWFKPILNNPLRDPGRFWDGLQSLPPEPKPIPAPARAIIEDLLPDRKLPYALHHRLAGLGSLGKPRHTAIAQWQGGPVAREAKALTISAAGWAQEKTTGPFYGQIIANAIRSPDPFLKVQGPWIVRRLAPDCRRLEIASLNRVDDKEWLLHAMGFETANVHLGTRPAGRSVARHLADLPANMIRKAALTMRDLVIKDFERYCRGA